MTSFWANWRAAWSLAAQELLPSLPLPSLRLSVNSFWKLKHFGPALLFSSVVVQPEHKEWKRWCGKHYEFGSPVDDPGRRWVGPIRLEVPLLDFRCIPAEQPYLEGEFSAALIIDITTSYQHGEPLIGLEPGEEYTGDLLLHVYATSPPSGTTLVLNTTISASHSSLEFALDLSVLQASSQAYDISCSARRVDAVDQTFSSSSALRYLPPNPFGGSTVKLDRRTGGLLVDEAGRWVPLLPTGFYTVFSDYVATTHLLDEMAQQGFNTLHIIPPGGRVAPYLDVLRYAESIGLYIMLDLRHAYADPNLVEESALTMRSFKRFLLWYTADEPDGTQDPSEDVNSAYEQLYALDGYHPVSLVLNCGDFGWADYTKGADIVLSDPYAFNVNNRFSSEYKTKCNVTYGCCGCDNCFAGDPFLDVTSRLDTYSERRAGLGRERNMTFWLVPQAFHETFWSATPTADEFRVASVLGLIHGARGILPWNAPTTTGIATTFSSLARHLSSTLAPLILSPTARQLDLSSQQGLHLAAWTNCTVEAVALVLLANPSRKRAEAVRLRLPLGFSSDESLGELEAVDVFEAARRIEVSLRADGALQLTGELEPLGTGAWLVSQRGVSRQTRSA